MATNPFLRFARGAAAPTPCSGSVKQEQEEGSGISIAAGESAASRKRQRDAKEEPRPPTTTPMLEDDGATDRTESNRRVELLQRLVDARRDGPDAAIDVYGTQACVFSAEVSPQTKRFQILVAALLSSQTQDPITHGAMQRLHSLLRDGGDDASSDAKQGLTIAAVRASSAEKIQELLLPVGFYRRKAQQIKQIAETLHTQYRGDIPRSLDDLLALPGVGPKIARVVLLLAWDDVGQGLIVDTHVHRLSQRLAWVGPRGTKTPEETRTALEEWVPRAYWRDFSRNVVGFGQNVCLAVHPKCVECPLAPVCPSAFTYRHPGKKTKKKTKTTEEPMALVQYDEDSDDVFESHPYPAGELE